MKRYIRLTAGLVFGIGTLLCGGLFVRNVIDAIRFHHAIFSGTVLPEMAVFSVDVSAVTTFVPFFGFLLLLAGTLRIRRNPEWPFFRSYNQLNIALGLAGTIWGIIMVGFFPQKEISISTLMACLHTAMFSTLASVLWIMVLRPLVFDPVMHVIRDTVLPPVPEEDPNTLLDDFSARLSAASEGLAAQTKKTDDLNRAMTNLLPSFRAIAEHAEDFRKSEASALESFRTTALQLESLVRTLRTENEELLQRERSLSLEKAETEAALNSEKEETAKLRTALNDAETRCEELTGTLERIRTALR